MNKKNGIGNIREEGLKDAEELAGMLAPVGQRTGYGRYSSVIFIRAGTITSSKEVHIVSRFIEGICFGLTLQITKILRMKRFEKT